MDVQRGPVLPPGGLPGSGQAAQGVEPQGHRRAGQPDYVTIRLPAAILAGLPVQFDPGQRVQVHGWLESREFEYTLDEYLDDAQGPKPEVEPAQAEKVVAHRATTWITADRIVVVPNNRGK